MFVKQCGIMIKVWQLFYHNLYSAIMYRLEFDDSCFGLILQQAFWNELNDGWLEMNREDYSKVK